MNSPNQAYLKGKAREADECTKPGDSGIHKGQESDESDEVGSNVGNQRNGL